MGRALQKIPVVGHTPGVAAKRSTTHWARRGAALGLTLCTVAFAHTGDVLACTAFCAVGNGRVLVGNNEDWSNPRTKLRFVPATPGSFGRLYVGFDDMWPQGGMNERGLWFDGFAAPAMKATGSAALPHFPGNIIDRAMAECSTVEEVVRLFSRYNRAFLREAILMFADASGDAVSIEPDAMVRKTGRHFVQTNFHQSLRTSVQDERFATASEMLERAGEDISVDLFRRILAATYQAGGAPTQYSNVYDLRSRTMYLYYFHDFERAVTFHLADELKKGDRVLDIPALFPPNAGADAFAARRKETPRTSGGAAVTGLLVVVVMSVLLAVGALVRGGRRVRIGMAVLFGGAAMAVAITVVALGEHRRAAPEWIEFSIGPATGDMEALVVDSIRRDPALVLLAQVGRITRGAPPYLRQHIANALTIH